MAKGNDENAPVNGQPGKKGVRKRRTIAEAAKVADIRHRIANTYVERNPDGTFAKGTPSPNPGGAKPKGRRMFGMTQTAKDLLELLEQPVTITKGKKKQQVPAIVAIYDRMIHMAIAGDWQAMRKCVELREQYSNYREKTLGKLLSQAGSIRLSYEGAEDQMPEDLRSLVEFIELNVAHGQYRAA